jgi:hypothetical protein
MIPEFELTVVRGTLTFPGADYENVFGPAGAIALLRQDSDLLILPIHQAVSGGHLVSRSGVDGARAVDALEFGAERVVRPRPVRLSRLANKVCSVGATSLQT